MTLPPPETLNAIVGRVFRIDDVTTGDAQHGYLVRYHGTLQIDSVQAYDQLADALQPYDVTPLFRIENGRQTVLLVQGVNHPKPGRIRTNILLFCLTLISVLFIGELSSYSGPVPTDLPGTIKTILANLWIGWPYAASLMGILLAHELGHYFAGRYHKTAVTLPYFIPLPFPPLGTLGAFIQMKERPKNVRILFDIGVAGPLAGLVVAVPVLILGLMLSKIAPVSGGSSSTMEGTSLLYLGLKYLVTGKILPAPLHYDLPPLLYWVRYFFTARPFPIGGLDVMLNPVAWAGWVGLLVTFLNLIPAGQFDGGHVVYSVFGRRVNILLPFLLIIIVLLGFYWPGWYLWAFLIFFLGRGHAEPLDQITALDPRRRAVALLMLVIFLLVLTPVPLTTLAFPS